MSGRPEDLQEEIEALKNKTEQNQQMAQEANSLANAALKDLNDTVQVSLKGSLPNSTSVWGLDPDQSPLLSDKIRLPSESYCRIPLLQVFSAPVVWH